MNGLDASTAQHLDADTDLDPLRKRADFAAFVAKAKAAGKSSSK